MGHNRAMKEYVGTRGPEGCLVLVDGAPLDPRIDLRNHSEDGFEWGYEGGGPLQLALALLADVMDNDAQAVSDYRDFMRSTIMNLHGDSWRLTDDQIHRSLSEVVHVPLTLDELLAKVRGE